MAKTRTQSVSSDAEAKVAKPVKEKKEKVEKKEKESTKASSKDKTKKSEKSESKKSEKKESKKESKKSGDEKKEKKEKKEKVVKTDDTEKVKGDKKGKKRAAKDEEGEEAEPKAKRTRKVSKTEAAVTDGEADVSVEEDKTPPEAAFAAFPISAQTIKRLLERGVTHLFPIQEASFQPIYDGKDVLGRARTGTGKTLSFTLPIVERLQEAKHDGYGRAPRALVVAPTRELAKQVCGDFVSVSSGLSATCVYGGTPYREQENEFRRGVDIVVGTPGRLTDHINRGNLKLTDIKFLVLDEADQMLDIGFKDAIEEILAAVTSPHQTLLYSATIPEWVNKTARTHMKPDKVTIDLVKDEKVQTSTLIEHLAVRCHWQDRANTLRDILMVYAGSQGRTIVFTETKREANELALTASLKGGCGVLHGDIAQGQRETTLQGFRDGTFKTLIATDVAARGLDIPEVEVVVQCEPPQDVDTYVHRSGRTGRAGKSGVCIVFYKPNQEYMLGSIERRTGMKFTRTGAPQPAQIMRAVGRDSKKVLEKVPDNVLPHFEKIAEELIATRGPVHALAAALAHISGYTNMEGRSLLNSSRGFTTFLMKVNTEMRATGYAWNILEKNLSYELKETCRGMRMCLDRMGCVFDVPNDKVELVEELWKDGSSATLIQATELPPLVEVAQAPAYGNAGGRGGRGGFGGGRGGFGGGGRGGYGNSPRGGGGGRGGSGGGARGRGRGRGGFNS